MIHARSGRGRRCLRPDVVDALLDVARHGFPVAPDGAPQQDRRPRDVAGALRIDHQHQQPGARELFDRAVTRFNGIQGQSFLIGNTTFAIVELPELKPGIYDVGLWDYRRSLALLPKVTERLLGHLAL